MTVLITDDGVAGAEEGVPGFNAAGVSGRAHAVVRVVDGFSGWQVQVDDGRACRGAGVGGVPLLGEGGFVQYEIHPARDGTEQLVLDSLGGQEAATLITSMLRDDQAEVLLLRLLGDLDVDQVAAIMQRSPNWVRVTQHRAVRTLAKKVGAKIAVMR